MMSKFTRVGHMLWLIAALAVPAAIHAADTGKSPSTGRAEITFKAKGHNFGTSKGKKDIVHRYKFENTGGKELIISQLRTTCKCMKLEATKKRVPPGGKEAIKATFLTAGLAGKQEYTIFVHTNDAESPVTKLTISGTIEPEVFLAPSKFVLGDIPPDKLPLTRQTWVRCPAKQHVSITKVECDSEHLRGKIVRFDQGNHSYLIEVSLQKGVPIGPFAGTVTIHTDSKHYPRLPLRLAGRVSSVLDASPGRVFFGRVKKGDVMTREIAVSAGQNNPAKITKVETDVAGLTLATRRSKRGKYTIVATLDTKELLGIVKGSVLVWTAGTKAPSLKLPVLALVKEQ